MAAGQVGGLVVPSGTSSGPSKEMIKAREEAQGAYTVTRLLAVARGVKLRVCVRVPVRPQRPRSVR